jgi:predicted RNase H-like HicB family nuclease
VDKQARLRAFRFLLPDTADASMTLSRKGLAAMTEIIFEVREDEADGGYTASALGYGIHTQAETLDELRTMVKDAVNCYFDDSMQSPKIIRLHFVREEVLAA